MDWARNVRAANRCTIAWQGVACWATSPELVDLEEVRSAVSGWLHRLTAVAGAERYLRLDRGEAVPKRYRGITAAHPAGPAVPALGGIALLAVLLWRTWRRSQAA